VALFDRLPPLTNPARARYALLAALGRNMDAAAWARAAWRGGTMSDADEAAIDARWGKLHAGGPRRPAGSAAWDGAPAQAQRMLARASASRIALAQARLAIQQGQTSEAPPPEPAPDPQGAATVRPPRPHARNHAPPPRYRHARHAARPGLSGGLRAQLPAAAREQRPPRCWPAAPRWHAPRLIPGAGARCCWPPHRGRAN
jgi:hypothetical protein